MLWILAVVGYIGLSFGDLFQIHKIYKRKHARDLSKKSLIIFVLSLFCIQIYMYLNLGDWPVFLGNLWALFNRSILLSQRLYYK